jgi:hypothetical protein
MAFPHQRSNITAARCESEWKWLVSVATVA